MRGLILLCGLLAVVYASEEVLEMEARDKLGDIRNELKSCFGIKQYVWMTKATSKADLENCVRKATGTSNPGPYLKCIGLKTGWYQGKTGVFRSSGDNLLRCIVQSESWCPTRGKREVEEEEEAEVDVEARGIMNTAYIWEIKDCLGTVENKFLTAITTRQGFADCIRKTCPNYPDSGVNAVAGCLNLALGKGPGPKCDWMDYFTGGKYMIMNNRGKLGACLRAPRIKCKA